MSRVFSALSSSSNRLNRSFSSRVAPRRAALDSRPEHQLSGRQARATPGVSGATYSRAAEPLQRAPRLLRRSFLALARAPALPLRLRRLLGLRCRFLAPLDRRGVTRHCDRPDDLARAVLARTSQTRFAPVCGPRGTLGRPLEHGRLLCNTCSAPPSPPRRLFLWRSGRHHAPRRSLWRPCAHPASCSSTNRAHLRRHGAIVAGAAWIGSRQPQAVPQNGAATMNATPEHDHAVAGLPAPFMAPEGHVVRLGRSLLRSLARSMRRRGGLPDRLRRPLGLSRAAT